MRNATRITCLLAAAGLVALGGCAGTAPPTKQMTRSQAAVSQAEGAKAYEFAPVEFQAAREKLQQARNAMNDEDYKEAERLAEQAEVDANLAYTKARSAQSMRAVEQLQKDIEVLQRELGG